jgi:hypothetical protein
MVKIGVGPRQLKWCKTTIEGGINDCYEENLLV